MPRSRPSWAIPLLLALLLPLLAVGARPARAATYTPPASPRDDLLINDDWRFKRSSSGGEQAVGYDDSGSSWSTVDVPHTYNAQDGQDGGGNYYRGGTWYRKRVAVPSDYAGRRVLIQFAGVNKVADVYVDGELVGRHEGGFARFRFDITDFVEAGEEALLAVRVDNGSGLDIAPLRGDFTQFGGIYRNVRLLAVDPVHLRLLDRAGPGVYLHQRSVSEQSADVEVETRLWNDDGSARDLRVRTVITGSGGTVVRDVTTETTIGADAGTTVTQDITIDDPRLWDGREDPFLYTAHVEVRDDGSGALLDLAREPLGLRSFSVDPDTGFSLNGRNYELRGVNMHQDGLDQGWALTDEDHARKFELMDEMGVNSIRLAHYQHDQYTYNRADQDGYVVYTEIPLIDEIDASQAFEDNAEEQLRELIRQNYNHPSVVFWGVGNELRDPGPEEIALVDELDALVGQEDPTRISAYAHCCSDDAGALANQADVSGHNEYHGWYYGQATDFRSWAEDLHADQPDVVLGVTEYGAGGSIDEHVEHPAPKPGGDVNADGTPHTEEYQARLHEQHLRAIEDLDFLFGTYVWNMFDFASDGRDEGDTAGRNDKGLVTYDWETRKDAFWLYRANWSDESTLRLASRRFDERTDPVTAIKAYANTGDVTLRVNGTVVGTLTPDEVGVVYWPDVELEPGDNTVQVTATRNGRQLSDSVTWTVTD